MFVIAFDDPTQARKTGRCHFRHSQSTRINHLLEVKCEDPLRSVWASSLTSASIRFHSAARTTSLQLRTHDRAPEQPTDSRQLRVDAISFARPNAPPAPADVARTMAVAVRQPLAAGWRPSRFGPAVKVLPTD
jgi:hypothetical protein